MTRLSFLKTFILSLIGLPVVAKAVAPKLDHFEDLPLDADWSHPRLTAFLDKPPFPPSQMRDGALWVRDGKPQSIDGDEFCFYVLANQPKMSPWGCAAEFIDGRFLAYHHLRNEWIELPRTRT